MQMLLPTRALFAFRTIFYDRATVMQSEADSFLSPAVQPLNLTLQHWIKHRSAQRPQVDVTMSKLKSGERQRNTERAKKRDVRKWIDRESVRKR